MRMKGTDMRSYLTKILGIVTQQHILMKREVWDPKNKYHTILSSLIQNY